MDYIKNKEATPEMCNSWALSDLIGVTFNLRVVPCGKGWGNNSKADSVHRTPNTWFSLL